MFINRLAVKLRLSSTAHMLYLHCMLEEKFRDKLNSFTTATLKCRGSELHRVLERIIFVILYFSEVEKRNSNETSLHFVSPSKFWSFQITLMFAAFHRMSTVVEKFCCSAIQTYLWCSLGIDNIFTFLSALFQWSRFV